MALFEKKFCDICGEKISLLGNRKLEDGNMCKNCAHKISPFFNGRRHTTLADMKEHLAYREANKAKVPTFLAGQVFGENTKLYLDASNSSFLVSSQSPRNWDAENPDIIPLSEVTGCDLNVVEDRDEIFKEDAQGNRVSYNPKRYRYTYDFHIKIHVHNRWFDEIEFQLNSNEVENSNSAQYHRYESMGNEIRAALTQRNASPQGFVQNGFAQQQSFTQNTINPIGYAAAATGFMQTNPTSPAGGPVQGFPPQSYMQQPQMPDARPPINGQQPGSFASQPRTDWFCPNCGAHNEGKFCENCGTPRP